MKPQDQKNETTPVALSKTGETELTNEQLDSVAGGAIDGYRTPSTESGALMSKALPLALPATPKIA